MYPYQDQALTIRKRVEDLVARMSLQEKVGQVNQHLYGWDCYEDNTSLELTESFKEHVAWGGGVGALYGLFRADPWSKVDYETGISLKDSWKLTNKVQKYIIEHSRWGIPALIVEECPHGHLGLDGVSYPVNIGKGNSFNTEIVKASSELMAAELALKGVNIALVSTLDLLKDPRWGRSEECFGEDPTLAAKMSEAVVAGFQGNLIEREVDFLDQTVAEIAKKDHQIGVVLKHCIAQGEAQGGHNSGTVTLGEREFSDIYSPLLSSVSEAAGVMAAYNDIDGVPCHTNGYLLNELLRAQHNFQGFVMADGIALDRLSDVYPEQTVAGSMALNAGVDLSLWDHTYMKLGEAVQTGELKEEILDQAVSRLLAIKFLLGLFDNPYVTDPEEKLETVLKDAKKMNEAVAKESLTLLKNNGILPLSKEVKTISVVGPNADSLYNMLGDYTAPQPESLKSKTIYQEIKKLYHSSKVLMSQGCEVRKEADQETSILEAIENSKEADVIVLALGGSSARNFNMEFLRNGAVTSKGINMDSGENVDVASLSLGGQQLRLLRELAKLDVPIISVLVQGRPYDLTEVSELSAAVLVSWFPGQTGGTAIAKTLSGENNPSGKLSVSYPRNSQQLPVYYYQRDASKQDDYYDLSGSPLYEFGAGLSYTTFSYKDLQVQQNTDTIAISVKVKNTGKYTGQESVLLFVKLFGGHIIQRMKLLKDFKKESFACGEEKEIHFCLKKTDLQYMDLDYQIKEAEKISIKIDELEKTIYLNE